MLKGITQIKLSGANFNSMTLFDFFNPHDGDKVKTIKGSLVYGRNGTGKSTIARAFRKLAGGTAPTINDAVFYDDACQPIILTEEEKKHIFIFDEDFVDKNVRLQQDHLDTIVILGQAANLIEKIEKAEMEKADAEIAYEKQNTIFKEYNDESNVKSPKYYISLLESVLRGDDNWSGRDREINRGRQNTAVRDDTYKKFVPLTPSKPKTELITDYKTKMSELEIVRSGASTIDVKVPSIPSSADSYDDKAVQNLLAMKIEKPELSEREKKLLALVQGGKTDELSQRLAIFQNSETIECPYCYQTVSPEHKKFLVESIEKVLSKVVEDHQLALKSYVLDQIVIDLSLYKKIVGLSRVY
jgi:uncharacterized protein (UPF0335 family)